MTRLFEPRRTLGRTGFIATRLGIGDVADRRLTRESLVATLRRAMDAGRNVIDKVDHPDRPVAPQVEERLARLGLDQADAFVLHGLSSVEQWQACAAVGCARPSSAGAATWCCFRSVRMWMRATWTRSCRWRQFLLLLHGRLA